MGNLFSCLGSSSDSPRGSPQVSPQKETKRRSHRKVGTADPEELEGALRPFKRPPSKHRQRWQPDSTSSGTNTTGIRPGGSSISTVGSMVSSNTLAVIPEHDKRPPGGRRDWEEGPVSPEGKEGAPSWEQVDELNGEVCDLRQRLRHEKEEANRLKLMVERLRVSNSNVGGASPDTELAEPAATPVAVPLPMSSVLATQRTTQQDTYKSNLGANGSPEQMSRPTEMGVSTDNKPAGMLETATRSKRPSTKRAGSVGLSLDDMVELGSPVIATPEKNEVATEPERQAAGRGGESAGFGSGEAESSSDRDFASSGQEDSPKYEQRSRRVAPSIGQPSGVLIERRREHSPHGLGPGLGAIPDPHKNPVNATDKGKGSDGETGVENLSGGTTEGADEHAVAERREALRRQSRNERAKARLVRRQAGQVAAAGRSPLTDVPHRQPLGESHLSHPVTAEGALADSEEEGLDIDGGALGGTLEAQGIADRGMKERLPRREAADYPGQSDSDMSFGGWLPEGRTRRDRDSAYQKNSPGTFSGRRGRRASAVEEPVAEEEPEQSASFSFGQQAPSRAPAVVNALDRASKQDSPARPRPVTAPGRATWVQRHVAGSPTTSSAKASRPASSSDDSLCQEENVRREAVQSAGSDSSGASMNPSTPAHSPKASSQSQLLNTRERLALKGVLVGPSDWASPKDRASPEATGRARAEARARKALWGMEAKAEDLLEPTRHQSAAGLGIETPSTRSAKTEGSSRVGSNAECEASVGATVPAAKSPPRKVQSPAAHELPAVPMDLPPVATQHVSDGAPLTPTRALCEKTPVLNRGETVAPHRTLPSKHLASPQQPLLEAPSPRRPVSARTTVSGASSAASESVQADNPFRIGLTSSQASVQRSPGSAGVTVDQPQSNQESLGAQLPRVLLRTSSEVESRKAAASASRHPVPRSRSFDAPNPKPTSKPAGLPPRPALAPGNSTPGGNDRPKPSNIRSRIPVSPLQPADLRRAKVLSGLENLVSDSLPSPFRTRDKLSKDPEQQPRPIDLAPGAEKSRETYPLKGDAIVSSPETPPATRAWAHLQEVSQLGASPRAPKARPTSSSQSAVEPPVAPLPSKPKHRRRHSHGSNGGSGDLDVFAALPDFKENADPRPNEDDDVMRRLARYRARRGAGGGSPGGVNGPGVDGGRGMWQMQENTVEVPGGLEEPGTPTPVLSPDGRGIPNRSDKYKEDQKVRVHSTPFEVRVEMVIAKQQLKQRKVRPAGLLSSMDPMTI